MTSWYHGSIVLLGTDEGVTNLKNNNYVMNGVVEEAYGIFQNYQGRDVHMSGDIIWYPFGAPHYAPGVFRIN